MNLFKILHGEARCCAAIGALVLLALSTTAAGADEATCGPLANSTGPYDARLPRTELNLAEQYHFTRDVESLKAGSTGTVGGDLDYILRAFPNHHRALAAMMNLQFKAKTEHPRGANWPVYCYFDRAIRFKPDDAIVHTIYAVYLLRLNRTKEAVAEFKQASELGDDSGNLHYNLGLAYFDLRDYDQAAAEAKKANERGFTLPGLQQKLAKVGKWQ